MDNAFEQQSAWFSTPLGRRYIDDEQAVMAALLDTVFGDHLIQIGQWHAPETFLAHARTQKKTLIDWRPEASADVLMQPNRLAFAPDSVDAVVLPHTLELVPSPHALLREVGRILRADGHLIVLSFEPGSLWGMRHLVSRRGFPVAQRQLIREGRLRDWLELLSFAVGPAKHFCHVLPVNRFAWLGRASEESRAARWLPFLRAGNCIAAQKRVFPLTPVRNVWRPRRLRVVSSLVKPSASSAPRSESS